MYDLIVIGAGPGGYVAAIKAAQLGMKTAIVEYDEIGGTCLNRGCIPTKSFIKTTEILHEIKNSADFGVAVSGVDVSVADMYKRKDAVVESLKKGIESLFKGNKIDVIKGKAFIESKNIVKVNDDRYETKAIVIATGSIPFIPPIEGSDSPNVVTSDEIIKDSNCFYKKIVIIGAGVIGVEFASVFSSLGSEVTLIEAAPRILPLLDKEISQNLAMILKKRGVKICTSSKVEKIISETTLTCNFSVKDTNESVNADGILIATGRIANTQNLFDATLGLNTERGFICTDDNFSTSVEGIYAIGDVVKNNVQLAHMASAQGLAVVDKICKKENNINLSLVPSCIYTSPEIASVGLDEAEAVKLGINIKIGKYIMTANCRAVIAKSERSFVKLVFDADTTILLGAQIMCDRATDMIGELTLAIDNRLTVEKVLGIIRSHPTFGEAIGEAAENAFGTAIHTMPKLL